MSENQNWTNLKDQFLDSVTEALNTGDFNGINDLLTTTVNGALQEARNQAMREKERQREKVQRQYDDWQQRQQKQILWQQERREKSIRETQNQQVTRTPAQVIRDMRTMVKAKRIGSVSSVLLLVFGIMGMGISSIGLVTTILALVFGGGSVPAVSLVLWGIWWFGSLIMMDQGTRQRARLDRFDRYLQICGYKMYGMVEELAKQTGKSVRYVRKDLRRLLKKGFLPEGHLDEQETCFMLNNTVYQQYMDTVLAHRQAEEAARAPKTPEELQAEEQRAREAELNAMVTEGRDYIRRLHELNDAIPGEPISAKLYQLENLLDEIFDCVKEHPEQMHRMHKLMDYYLPTTLKLVEAYKEFDEVSVPGEDILSAKAEIEKTLDAINMAFKELLNALFQDTAMDVTTDAQVLQTMLAKEGLTREMEPLTLSGGQGDM